MLAKLATLVQSKTALAVLGVVLVGGGSGAVAVAATTGHLSTLGVNLNVAGQTKTPEASDKATGTPDAHAHSVGVEGLLTACDQTSTPNTVSVTDRAGKSWTFVVSSTTKYNGDTKSQDGASSAKGDNSANAGGASTTVTVATSPATLADVCATTNLKSRYVEVEATPNGAEYDAWKVTLQNRVATSGSSSASGDTSANSSDQSSSAGDSSQSTPEPKEFSGTISNVTASGFTLTHNGASYTVTVTVTTKVSGAASLAAIPANANVTVYGTVSGSTITAQAVVVKGSDN